MTIERTIMDRMGSGVASDDGLSALGIAGRSRSPKSGRLGMSNPAASSSARRTELRPKIEFAPREGLRVHGAADAGGWLNDTRGCFGWESAATRGGCAGDETESAGVASAELLSSAESPTGAISVSFSGKVMAHRQLTIVWRQCNVRGLRCRVRHADQPRAPDVNVCSAVQASCPLSNGSWSSLVLSLNSGNYSR